LKGGGWILAISKEKKQQLVAQYQELASSSQGMILTSFSGLNVKETEALRKQVREAGGTFHVVKNTLAKLAFDQAGLELPEGALDGTTAIGFTQEGITDLAKAIVEVVRETETLKVKGGLIEGMVYDARQITKIASLPSLQVVQAQLLGLLQTPASRVAGALSGSVRQIVSVVSAYAKTAGEDASPSAA
jgi:large subunit ribosomal protein L10